MIFREKSLQSQQNKGFQRVGFNSFLAKLSLKTRKKAVFGRKKALPKGIQKGFSYLYFANVFNGACSFSF